MNDDSCQYPLPTTHNESCSLPKASRLDLVENASAGWLKDASKINLSGSFALDD